MKLRIRYQKRGSHVHCRVFVRSTDQEAFAKCGDLVFNTAEWQAIGWLFRTAEFVEEE